MYRFLSAIAVLALICTAGCEDEWFDYYPHHEIPSTHADVVKSGPDYYGGNNSHTPIIIPGSGSATNPSASSTTTSSPTTSTTVH